MVMVYIEFFQEFELQRIQVHIDRQQVKREVPDVHKMSDIILLEELLADDGALGPEAGIVALVAAGAVDFDQLAQLL